MTDLPAAAEPFSIDIALQRIGEAVRPYPKAALFELAEEGFSSAFEQLVACMISIRTRDETTVEVCLRLFAEARTPEQFADLPEDRLIALLNGATFPEPKARDLKVIAHQILNDHGGRVPDSLAELTAFRGVGPKIAALTLAVPEMILGETALSFLGLGLRPPIVSWGVLLQATFPAPRVHL